MWLRFQRARGLRLFRLGRWQVEGWFCPRGEVVPAHAHDRMTAFIFYVAGGMIFKVLRGGVWRARVMGWRMLGRGFRIGAGEVHAAEVTGGFGMFLVVEKWICEPTSVVLDFRVSA